MRLDTKICIAFVLAALALIVLPGCEAPPSADVVRAAIDQAQTTSAQLDQVLADAESQLATLPEGDERDQLLDLVSQTTGEKARVDAVLAELRGRLDAAGEDADAIDAAAIALQTSGGSVPPPWGVYLAAGGSLLLAVNRWVKAARTRRAAETVIRAIEQEKTTHNGTINFRDPATKASLRSRMSEEPAALTLVEQARRAV